MYRLTASSGKFNEVRAMCEQYGMRLWVPDDFDEINAVETAFDLTKNVSQEWGFLRYIFPDGSQVLKVYFGVFDEPHGDCITIANTACPVTKYAPREPSASFENCTGYYMLSDGIVGWNDVTCDNRYYGICEAHV